ncbi:MAG: hypothetical protein HY231_24200 [Acidobacteria bacterium]|nr:hypothetical protein [Acidobacteriota bacterium]
MSQSRINIAYLRVHSDVCPVVLYNEQGQAFICIHTLDNGSCLLHGVIATAEEIAKAEANYADWKASLDNRQQQIERLQEQLHSDPQNETLRHSLDLAAQQTPAWFNQAERARLELQALRRLK